MQNTAENSMNAIQISEYGGSDKLHYQKLAIPTPAQGEALVKVEAAGINYIDIYMRTGLYPKPLPLILGKEGAGTIEKIGPGVTTVRPGDRVAWCDAQGSYASHAVIPVDKLAPLPEDLSFNEGAAAILQGLTAYYLTHDTYQLGAEDICLIHAAAGGVGLLLCQMAKQQGARVIGTVSTAAKAELARQAGADEVILYTQQDFVEAVQQITQGQGVHVVYDSVGADTFFKSLHCLRKRGLMVSFGQSSGVIPPFEVSKLAEKSLFITRTSLFSYVDSRAELLKRTQALFSLIASRKLNLKIDHVLPLAQAAQAQQMLEERKTTGKILLIP